MKLYPDQQMAFEAIEAATRPVFVTGAAGTGKSQLLRHLRDYGKDAALTEVVAFTGAAAVNVDGRTIHNLILNSKAWTQSIQVYGPLRDAREIRKSSLEDLARLKVLIIDEISMVRADMMDALDRAFRMAKGNQLPFGGIRLVMFGDVRQLPPFVVEWDLLNRESRFLDGYEDPSTPYFFMAHVFSLTPIERIELTIQKRVVGDEAQPFIDSLNGLRVVPPRREAIEYVNDNSQPIPHEHSTFLFSQRQPAHKLNMAKLYSLSGETRRYRAIFKRLTDEVVDDQEMDRSSDDLPAPRVLDLKVGARVMVVANLDVKKGLVNGATGTVLGLNEASVSMILDRTGETFDLYPHSFDWKGLDFDGEVVKGDEAKQSKGTRRTKIIGSFIQIPLILAWAVTIHKAQGATLERAAIDFEGQYHSPGQAYVALSRLTGISGLSRKGRLGAWHFIPYSQHVVNFDSANRIEPSDESTFDSEFQLATPWRSLSEIESLLDNQLELIPQVKDYHGFSHRKRMQYLRDQKLVAPSRYLRDLYKRNPEEALILARNIDRSMRNKPLILSSAVLGSHADAELRDELEITLQEKIRLQFSFGDDWQLQAMRALGSGTDVKIDLIPEFEATSIVFESSSHTWKISRVENPAAKERLWEFCHPRYQHPRECPKFSTLGQLLKSQREMWQDKTELRVKTYGSLEPHRLLEFLPFLGVPNDGRNVFSLNGKILESIYLQPGLSGEIGSDYEFFPDFSPYPAQRFSWGEHVTLTIGAYSGRRASILHIEEIDYVQYLTVLPEGSVDTIRVKGSYARRLAD